eukprot:CAMPEP_0114682500 /NCGR_PEP_ID=MMETSP0191-20121206/56626_1 /TAXON_ID=126664 /ORGANISM="Sorites sp." /LENGTH=195 /DNA_ID=CAMNT_0001962217 /DNA_START=217 /DNA_END=802 /DNA_ORIENTATION=+
MKQNEQKQENQDYITETSSSEFDSGSDSGGIEEAPGIIPIQNESNNNPNNGNNVNYPVVMAKPDNASQNAQIQVPLGTINDLNTDQQYVMIPVEILLQGLEQNNPMLGIQQALAENITNESKTNDNDQETLSQTMKNDVMQAKKSNEGQLKFVEEYFDKCPSNKLIEKQICRGCLEYVNEAEKDHIESCPYIPIW